jgi:hypothetical protein
VIARWTAIGTLALVVVGVWHVRTARADNRVREQREADERARAARERKEDRARAEEARQPKLDVREAPGFSGSQYQVEIYADVVNDGGSIGRGTVVQALIDGQVVATSRPVDVAPGCTERVALAVPRQFVEQLAGERPRYTGEMELRPT